MKFYVCNCMNAKTTIVNGKPRKEAVHLQAKYDIIEPVGDEQCPFCWHYAIRVFVPDDWKETDGFRISSNKENQLIFRSKKDETN